MSISTLIFDKLTEGQREYMQKGEGNIAVVRVGGIEYDIHPGFLQAYLEDYADLANFIRRKGRKSWGDISE